MTQSAQLVSLGVATGSSSRVLLLSDADGNSTTTLANSIAGAGFLVTVRPAPEYTWDGTNPSLDGFNLVIHLNGNTVGDGMTLSAGTQSALVDFVRAGGGFIGSQWSGYEASIGQGVMQDLVLTGFEGPFEENCFSCAMTYSQVLEQQSHPVLAGISSSFSFMADGHASGALIPFTTDPSVVLMRVPSGAPGVVVRSLSAGKVVNFSFAPNYGLGGDGQTLTNPEILQLYVNAVRWATGSSTEVPAKTPATLTLLDPAA
ncbi:MAG TPA: ThuA domain-containing protein, partial [Gemmatimonadales bacterium]|nr:ThuA domain-containing protein [Gemmatimonadales bacterium]